MEKIAMWPHAGANFRSPSPRDHDSRYAIAGLKGGTNLRDAGRDSGVRRSARHGIGKRRRRVLCFFYKSSSTHPSIPTQLFNGPVRDCFYLENPPSHPTFPVTDTVKNFGY
jgi:hypothetical protein